MTGGSQHFLGHIVWMVDSFHIFRNNNTKVNHFFRRKTKVTLTISQELSPVIKLTPSHPVVWNSKLIAFALCYLLWLYPLHHRKKKSLYYYYFHFLSNYAWNCKFEVSSVWVSTTARVDHCFWNRWNKCPQLCFLVLPQIIVFR